jgi:hypothetical protein
MHANLKRKKRRVQFDDPLLNESKKKANKLLSESEVRFVKRVACDRFNPYAFKATIRLFHLLLRVIAIPFFPPLLVLT